MFTDKMTGGSAALLAANSEEADMFSERNLVQEPEMEVAIALSLEDGQDAVIDQEGVFVISGDYRDAMIAVEVDDDDQVKIQLVLDDVSIVNEGKPVIKWRL
jgi:hypothetical protein